MSWTYLRKYVFKVGNTAKNVIYLTLINLKPVSWKNYKPTYVIDTFRLNLRERETVGAQCTHDQSKSSIIFIATLLLLHLQKNEDWMCYKVNLLKFRGLYASSKISKKPTFFHCITSKYVCCKSSLGSWSVRKLGKKC